MNCELSSELHSQACSGNAAAWNRLGELCLQDVPHDVSDPVVLALSEKSLLELEYRSAGLNALANDAYDYQCWDFLDRWESELALVDLVVRIHKEGAEQAGRVQAKRRQQVFTQAFEYFRTSARLGDPEGMWNCGWRYFLGEGVERSERNATLYWAHAAARGHAPAARQLAEMTSDDTLRQLAW